MPEHALGQAPGPRRGRPGPRVFEAAWGDRIERWFRDEIEERGRPIEGEARIAAEARGIVRDTWRRLGPVEVDARSVEAAYRRALVAWRRPLPCTELERLTFRRDVDQLVERFVRKRIRRFHGRRTCPWQVHDAIAFAARIADQVYQEILQDFGAGRVARVNDHYVREKARWKIQDRLRKFSDRDTERARNDLGIQLRDLPDPERELYFRLESALSDLPADRIAPAAEAVLGAGAPAWFHELARRVAAKKRRRSARAARRDRARTAVARLEYLAGLAAETLPDLGAWQRDTFAAWARSFLIHAPETDDFRSLAPKVRRAINRAILETYGIKLVSAPGQVIRAWIERIFVDRYPGFRREVVRRLAEGIDAAREDGGR